MSNLDDLVDDLIEKATLSGSTTTRVEYWNKIIKELVNARAALMESLEKAEQRFLEMNTIENRFKALEQRMEEQEARIRELESRAEHDDEIRRAEEYYAD